MLFFGVAFTILILSILLGIVFCDSFPMTSKFEGFFEVFFASFAAFSVTTLFVVMVIIQFGSEIASLFQSFPFLFSLPLFVGMNLLETTLEGETLYHFAQKHVTKDTEVVTNDLTGETYVTSEDGAFALHREETVIDAVMDLATCAPSFGYLYEDGSLTDEQREFVVVFSPYEGEKMDLIRGFNNGIDRVVCVEDGYRYIDGFTNEGGMIFGPDDWHWDGSVLVSIAMAKERPEEYLERLQDQYFTEINDCLLGEDTLRNLGFVPFDKRVHDERNMQYGKCPRGQSRSETYEYISQHYRSVSDIVFRNSWEIFVRLSDGSCPYCEDRTGEEVWDATDLQASQATLDGRSGNVPTCDSCGEPIA